MISAADVTMVRDGRTVLDQVTFRLEKGTCTGIVDPGLGAHKTLMRILATLTLPSAGRVSINGVDAIRDPVQARRHVSYASHGAIEVQARARLCVSEHLWLVARTRRAASEERAREIASRLALDLDGSIDRLTSEGRRALAMATAFGLPSDVILVDMPSGAPTAPVHAVYAGLIRDAIRDGGTVVTAADDFQYVDGVCDTVLVFDGGRLGNRRTAATSPHESTCTR
jgi:ABC-type Na+ transport system ATPase subunit NatA